MSAIVYVIIASTLAIAVIIGIALARQGHPEQTAGHRARLDDPADDEMLRAPGDRPGGPGQGGQHVIDPGEINPAPAGDEPER